MMEEYAFIMKNDVCEVVPRPKGKEKSVTCVSEREEVRGRFMNKEGDNERRGMCFGVLRRD
jgi:hypothetical protein